jgi:hypothetical protein
LKVPYFDIIWSHEPGGNIEHIAEHDLTQEDVEDVLFDPVGHDRSHSSGLPVVFGFTSDGRYIMVAYEQIDATTIYPVTAYEVEE